MLFVQSSIKIGLNNTDGLFIVGKCSELIQANIYNVPVFMHRINVSVQWGFFHNNATNFLDLDDTKSRLKLSQCKF